jgi:hypothetical protein
MMKRNDKVFLGWFLFAAIGFSLSLSPKAHPADLVATSIVANQTVQGFTGYKTWTRVNSSPFLLESYVSRMCAPAPAQLKSDSPHKNKYIFVYVNDLGRKAMMTEMNPQFPQGAVIIKEKLASQNSSSPELLTAMIKREKGYNPPSNDWEFVALSGDAETIQAQGKLDNCIACHTAQRSTDFVFRNYLPNDAMMNLK